ncbi:uncharacterized protein V2V93DRAFT_336589 [Kockiozyma suomiensis]|uniref:uncharacterized protein n=1 Tax=Kockiozyma suomiensis TaxID=1337062 RepID=UPI003343DE14
MIAHTIPALLLAALIPFTQATSSSTACASTSYAIPTDSNPVGWAKTKYNMGSMSRSISVKSRTEYGRMYDPDNTYSIYRDGGGSCTLNNRTFFVFDDTTAYRPDGSFGGFTSNSIAMVRDFDNPTELRDFSVSNTISDFEPIPRTAEETLTSKTLSKRYVLWTYTNCVQLGESAAAYFFALRKHSSSSSSYVLGNTAAKMQIDTSKNNLNVQRDTQLAFPAASYPYGSFANVVVNGVAYLYGLDSTYSNSYDVHVASVPVSKFWDTTKYQYWDASTSTWSYTVPVPTVRRQSSAAIQGTEPFSSGTIFYSEYHNQYLLIFFNSWVDSTFRVLTSPTPLGPWNVTNSVVWKTTPGRSYNYGGVAHPVYGSTPGATIGQKIGLHWSYQDEDGTTYPKFGSVTFK